LITDCDEEYEALYSANQWDNEQRSVINSITSLYDELDIDINIVSQDACDNDDGVYSSELMDTIIDDEMPNLWENTSGFDIVHLFSGKDLNAGSGWWPNDFKKGQANIDGIDNPQAKGYSVTQHAPEIGIGYSATFEDKQKILAHELGHNFGATHSAQGKNVSYWYGTVFEDTVMHESTTWYGKMQWSDGSASSSQDNADTVRQSAEDHL